MLQKSNTFSPSEALTLLCGDWKTYMQDIHGQYRVQQEGRSASRSAIAAKTGGWPLMLRFFSSWSRRCFSLPWARWPCTSSCLMTSVRAFLFPAHSSAGVPRSLSSTSHSEHGLLHLPGLKQSKARSSGCSQMYSSRRGKANSVPCSPPGTGTPL